MFFRKYENNIGIQKQQREFDMQKNEITIEEVTNLLLHWFELVETSATAEQRESLYLYPNSRFIMPDGTSMDFTYHEKMHTQWCDEKHECGKLYLTPLCDSPPRVRVEGTVYWEARYKGKEEIIKTVVGKSIIIERIADGSLRFVLHQNVFFHLVPGSASINM